MANKLLTPAEAARSILAIAIKHGVSWRELEAALNPLMYSSPPKQGPRSSIG